MIPIVSFLHSSEPQLRAPSEVFRTRGVPPPRAPRGDWEDSLFEGQFWVRNFLEETPASGGCTHPARTQGPNPRVTNFKTLCVPYRDQLLQAGLIVVSIGRQAAKEGTAALSSGTVYLPENLLSRKLSAAWRLAEARDSVEPVPHLQAGRNHVETEHQTEAISKDFQCRTQCLPPFILEMALLGSKCNII